jgi:hypothetical protein
VTSDADQAPPEKYAGDPSEELKMLLILILAPILVLVVVAAVYDLRQRRRRGPITGHDTAAALRRARANTEGRTDSTGSPGGGGAAGR